MNMEVSGEENVEPSSPMHTENINLGSENTSKNFGSLNHRRLFSEATKFENQVNFLDFAWGMEMKAEEVSLNPLKVMELDLNLQGPISLQIIQHLKEIPQKAFIEDEGLSFGATSRQAWKICDSKIYGSSLEDLGLSSTIMSYLKLPCEMHIAAKFKKLVLYAGRQCFINHLGSRWVDGKFGTLLLQLPVEGGHEGGHLNIEYQGRKKKFKCHTNSDKIFYMSSFYDCCDHFIEPVLQGNKLTLVYDLIWTNAKIEIPQNFPVFVTALKQIKKGIESWLHLLNSQNEGVLDISRKECPIFTEESTSFTPGTQRHFLYPDEVLKENILFVVLNEKYDEKYLAFEILRRQDRMFAEALLQCDSLEVHLALAKQKVEKVREENSLDVQQSESVPKKEYVKVLEVSHLIDSNHVTRNLSIELDWDKQCVGTIQPDEEKEVDKKDRARQSDPCSRYAVLIFWPKKQSVQIFCRFGLHSLVIRMCKLLSSLPQSEEDAFLSAKRDLRQLILFCGAEPEKAWIKSGMAKGELTLRLLRFCIALRAREEGLGLLRILGSNFEEEIDGGVAQSEGNFEGIQNEEVALAIAKFECQVAGWSAIGELIKRMVTPNRIAKQLIQICKLSKFFLNVNCIEGAKVVGDCVSSSFEKIDESKASKAKLCDVRAYIDMIVGLETNHNTSNRKRIASFILFFSKLRPSLQLRLILDFAAQKNPYLASLHSWQFVFRDLCEILSVSCKFQSPPIKITTLDFMEAIEAWLLEVSQEIELHLELRETIEPCIDLEYAELKKEAIPSDKHDSLTTEANVTVREETLLARSVDNKSDQASRELGNASNGSNSQGTSKDSAELRSSADDWSAAEDRSAAADKLKTACPQSTISPTIACDDWNAASDAWASTTESQRTSSKTTGGKGSVADDWAEKADSRKVDMIEKEIVPSSNVSPSNDDWGACADAWASCDKTTTSAIPAGTNDGSQCDWDKPSNVPVASSRPIASDDWNSMSYSKPGTAKSNYAPKSGSNDDWAVTEDPWGTVNGRSSSRTSQSDPWGSLENTSNSWTSGGYTARSGGRGGGGRGPPRPCPKCNEEGHTSYNCPTSGRGRNDGGRGGHRPCYKCNQEGHTPYECPTAPTRGRGGGRGAGRGTRVCYKCNQEGHISYDCPTGSTGRRGGGRGSGRPFYESSGESANPSSNQPSMDDWGIPASISNSRASNYSASSEKNDVWGTSSSTSDPWATGANVATPDARNSLGYTAPSRNNQPAMDDWGASCSSAIVTQALPSATSTHRNGTAVCTDDWGLAADAWSSVTSANSSAPSTKSNAIATTGGEDWSAEADVWSGRSGSTSKVNASVAANEMNDWTESRKTTIKRGNPSDPRLVSSVLSPLVWTGTISHRSKYFKINMENLDKRSSPELANLAMPLTLKVVGTIEPEKVWNYLKQVRATSLEKVVVFTFTRAANAEISYVNCYKYFLDGFHKRNLIGVVGSVLDSKLSSTIKDFYVAPLPKEDPIPMELDAVASAKFLRENRVSDLLLAIVVIQNKRPIDQASFAASSRPSKVAKVENTTIPVDETHGKLVTIQEVDTATENQAATLQPSSRLTVIRQKLQQDILSVDPVKARIHTHSGQQSAVKIPLSKTQILGKLLPTVQAIISLAASESSNGILQRDEEANPSQLPSTEEKHQIPAAGDGELLMKQAIMEELNRQIEASKQGKLAEVDSTLQSEKSNSTFIKPVKPETAEAASSQLLPDGPLTRSRTKRQPELVEEVPAVKRRKVTTSSRTSDRCEENEDLRKKVEMLKAQRRSRVSSREISTSKETRKRRCFVEECRNDAQTNSVYCSDECIASHVRDSLKAMSKEKMKEALEPSGTSLTPPSTSSDESTWKDSIDYSLLMNQPTPALASKLLALTQMRKSILAGTNPANLAEDTPVPVIERKTGKILCGSSAPKVSNLEQWLKSNSTYEIIKPDSLPIKPWLPILSTVSSTEITPIPVQVPGTASSSKAKMDGRSSKKLGDSSTSSKAKVSRKRSAETYKEEEISKVAKPDNESTRAISKSSLKEALWNRCKDIDDPEVDEAGVEEIANEVEESLYYLFKQDVGTKYKSKYRSLIYNIKDPKNVGLFLEIVTKQITPVQLVKMSTEELASKDLAEWREQEAKRQLNLIEKNEQERLSQVNKYLMKTHKGEEFIKEVHEDFDELDEDTSKMTVFPNTPPEESISKHVPSKIDSNSNSLVSNQTIEEKDENESSNSSGKIKDEVKRSKSSRYPSRHSESRSSESDYRRSDRRLEKKDYKRGDKLSPRHSKSKSRDRHHSHSSDRDKKQGKKEDRPTECKDSRFMGFNDGEEVSIPSQRLSADHEVPSTAAESDTILLQNKLEKQLAVLEELNRQCGDPERELIGGLPTLEVPPEREDLIKLESAVPSNRTSELSESKERCCNHIEGDNNQNDGKETVIAEVDRTGCDLEENSYVAVRTLGCKSSSSNYDEENVLCSSGDLLIAEDDDSFLDLDEQFLKQQAVVEELNSNLTTFIVANNIDIQSHDENLDSSFTEQTPTSDLKDVDIVPVVEPSVSSPVECVSGTFSTDPTVFDQSRQATPPSSIELDNTDSEVTKKSKKKLRHINLLKPTTFISVESSRYS